MPPEGDFEGAGLWPEGIGPGRESLELPPEPDADGEEERLSGVDCDGCGESLASWPMTFLNTGGIKVFRVAVSIGIRVYSVGSTGAWSGSSGFASTLPAPSFTASSRSSTVAS